MIFAPPGTGKTQLSFFLIKKMIEEGFKPENILFLTFSKNLIGSTKSNLKEQNKMNKSASGLGACTLSSLAMQIVGKYNCLKNIKNNINVIDD